MTASPLSNSMSDLAERAGSKWRASHAAETEAIALALETGHLLVKAKAEAPHGSWLPFLARAGIPERQAQRLIQLVRSGMKPDTVSDLGGIKAALDFVARSTPPPGGEPPADGEALLVTYGGMDDPFAVAWGSREHPGYCHLIVFSASTETGSGHMDFDRRPIRSERLWFTIRMLIGAHPNRPQVERGVDAEFIASFEGMIA